MVKRRSLKAGPLVTSGSPITPLSYLNSYRLFSEQYGLKHILQYCLASFDVTENNGSSLSLRSMDFQYDNSIYNTNIIGRYAIFMLHKNINRNEQ